MQRLIQRLSRVVYCWTYRNVCCKASFWFDPLDGCNGKWAGLCLTVMAAVYRLDCYITPDD